MVNNKTQRRGEASSAFIMIFFRHPIPRAGKPAPTIVKSGPCASPLQFMNCLNTKKRGKGKSILVSYQALIAFLVVNHPLPR
jgi:hypothetical protein